MLQNGVILIGVVLALVLGVLGILVVKRRRDEAEAEEHEFNPVLVAPAVAFAGDSGDEPEKTGLLAGLMARFRRSEEADEDDFEPEDLDAAVQASDRVSNVPRAEAGIAYAPPKDVREDTDKMLNDMGISDELLSLDDALSGIDAETADAPPAADLSNVAAAEAVPAADLAESAARAEHSAEEAEQDVAEQEVAEEAHQEEVAEEIAEESTGERAADRAAEAAPILDEAPPPAPADVTSAALPDEIAFTPGEIPAPTPAAAVVTEPVEPETFEFKLRDEVAQTSSAPAVVEPAPEQVETFDFRLDAMPVNEDAAAAALAESDAGLPESVALEIDPDADLAELSFDDTMLSDEDDAESPYKSRSGMDECDTKLDLATAYEAMGDVDDAIEILNEVIAEGNPGQVELAQRLKQSWQSA
jgi:FimV-like protein